MKILLIGYGTMNKITARLAEEEGHEIVGIIAGSGKDAPYPDFKTIDEAGADVAIDFSHPELLLPLLEDEVKTPLVIATTGQKEEIVSILKEKSTSLPVFFSANMSYGVHVMNTLLKKALTMLDEFDLEMVERHHNKKVDAPSGTLVKLLDTALEHRDGSYPVYDRSNVHEKRKKEEIGVSAIRGGSIVGTHDVIFAKDDEVIEITHQAQSKEIFANGALKAANVLVNRPNGFYDYNNLFEER
ncbi:4-hydroxy-tetrahydrodipicolinate reductase [Salinicoccus roseus]|uniref:4-hydroxy-tetrahydrodipicolinate reductase n=1 Tax=Salinicoccus roseus TaxID=45670 RepID=A0A0C2HR67_9STAP|nr:4-hydroxy-tetrahydrodipicolinate reductase [Salinicoccus roseus]KIH72006.1 dihydrodipicolinate reductase [Salinicoccus roseus]MDB0579156.1 4-hydroxy-tetrahydrodipicolinate reductase [Salinicoccus roseus]